MRSAVAWLARWREVIAWLLLVFTCAACIFTGVQVHQARSVTASERKSLMQLSDMLQTRLYQLVNASAVANAPAGKGGTASVDGNDAVGQVNITTGAAPTAGSLVHVTFHSPYEVQPILVVSPLDQSPPPNWYVTVDTNGFDIVVGTAPKANTNYPFSYFIAPRPWLMYLDGK
jgi:hypothetical protein